MVAFAGCRLGRGASRSVYGTKQDGRVPVRNPVVTKKTALFGQSFFNSLDRLSGAPQQADTGFILPPLRGAARERQPQPPLPFQEILT